MHPGLDSQRDEPLLPEDAAESTAEAPEEADPPCGRRLALVGEDSLEAAGEVLLRVSFETSFHSKQPKLEPKLVSALGCALTFASEAKFETEAKISFLSEKSEKIDLNFTSLCFASQQKLLNLSKAKNLKRKKAKKSEKSKKIDLIFASLCFASKRKLTVYLIFIFHIK